MRVVWEENWHEYPEIPVVGDYIQIRIERDDDCAKETLEGLVIDVAENEGLIYLTQDPYGDQWCWTEWRRGALPEQQSVVRMEAIDA